ncbi:MAG TPA: hypothetical protein VFR96_00675 [Povalibacter sp.]|jgi:hypothetical protein|nr:hypothetical protein [Povalibacter sp.]
MNPLTHRFSPQLQRWAAVLSLLVLGTAQGQSMDYQIVWVDVGDAASVSGADPARVGRHVFMASDVADMVMQQVAVSRVEVEPQVTAIRTGERFCLTSLNIVAFDSQGGMVKGAPLTISVRQDQRGDMGIQRGRKDICVRPAVAGEYPIRFTSVLPARDGTMRGAQIFVRATDAPAPGEPGLSDP